MILLNYTQKQKFAAWQQFLQAGVGKFGYFIYGSNN